MKILILLESSIQDSELTIEKILEHRNDEIFKTAKATYKISRDDMYNIIVEEQGNNGEQFDVLGKVDF